MPIKEETPANATGTAVAGTGDDSSTVVVKKKKKMQDKLMKRLGIQETLDRLVPDLEYTEDEITARKNKLKEMALNAGKKLAQDPDVRKVKGTQPKKYYKTLSKADKDKRAAHFSKQDYKKSDGNKDYKPAPGDAEAKTKTSKFTKKLAESVGIEVLNLDELITLDLTIDGTDEFDDKLNLIKGGGGALLQEKIVASASSEMIVIADESKCVDKLGKFPLPVEVVPFGVQSTKALIDHLLYSFGYSEALGVIRSKNNNVFITDEGNNIIDYKLSKIEDAEELSNKLNSLPGVVENGIFVNLCSKVIVAEPDGNIVLHTTGGKVSDFQNLDINEMNSLNAKILEIQNEI